jgi:hypothetical protein
VGFQKENPKRYAGKLYCRYERSINLVVNGSVGPYPEVNRAIFIVGMCFREFFQTNSFELRRKLAKKIIGAYLYQDKDDQEENRDVVFYAIAFWGKHELIAFLQK